MCDWVQGSQFISERAALLFRKALCELDFHGKTRPALPPPTPPQVHPRPGLGRRETELYVCSPANGVLPDGSVCWVSAGSRRRRAGFAVLGRLLRLREGKEGTWSLQGLPSGMAGGGRRQEVSEAPSIPEVRWPVRGEQG